MARMGKSKKTFREIIEKRRSWQRELRNEVARLSAGNFAGEIADRRDLFMTVCEQAGVDFDEIEKKVARHDRKRAVKAEKQIARLKRKSSKELPGRSNVLIVTRRCTPK